MELLKIAKTRFGSYYLTFRRLLKVREALASMVSSDSWQGLKDRAASASDRHDFQEVEDTVLDGQSRHRLNMFYNSPSLFIL